MKMLRLDLPLVAFGLFASACSEPEVRVYRESLSADEAAVSAEAPSGGVSAGLSWQVPAGWKAQGPANLRVETLLLPGGAELAITTFPGDVGGMLANINRWRGQLQLPPVSEAGLRDEISMLETPAGAVAIVSMTSPDGQSGMLGGVLPFAGSTWFFKLTGPAEAVQAQEAQYRAFLQSLRAPGGEVASGGSEGEGESEPASPSPTSSPQVQEGFVPENWVRSTGSAMRLASYAVSLNGEGSGDLGVFAFPGDAGGFASNLNRWRAQLGLPELSEAELRSMTQEITAATGESFYMLMLNSPEPNDQALLGAIGFDDERSWFLKLSGAKPLVAAQQELFVRYIEGLRLGGK
ncbi:MAG: hypothetical protein ACFB21_07865 [Opitutales bacterium]